MNDIQLLRNKIERLKGKKMGVEETIYSLETSLMENNRALRRHEQARAIVREVGAKTQEQLQYHISDISSMALDAVFPDPYELVVEFIPRRNKTECDIYFTQKGHKIDPFTASGVGSVDVATFALRIASWSMLEPRTIPVIILDEPFRFLSEDFQEKASLMIKEISKKLGIQFIIVTHESILASYADRIFEIKKHSKSKKSKVIQS
jgi:chromosome segregation ATPase